jgi:hypothetical protein
MLWCVFYIQDFFLKRVKISILVVFKVPQANCLWADFDKIWLFWADSVAMAMADSLGGVGGGRH